ncbi:MAG: DNA ligase (NAD+), partial [Verrucomicrobiales bacterium]
RSSQILEEHFSSLDELAQAPIEVLEALPDIGPIVAESIKDFFADPAKRDLVGRLRDRGVNLTRQQAAAETGGASQLLTGKTFVVTGTLSTYTRDEVAALIRQHGGKASGSISAKTDFLLAGEKAGSKLAKATSLGVQVISEDDFGNMING